MNTSANVNNKKNTLKSSLFWFIVLPFFTKNHSAHNSRVLWKNRGLKCSEIDNRRIVLNGRQTFRTNRPRTKVHTNVHFRYYTLASRIDFFLFVIHSASNQRDPTVLNERLNNNNFVGVWTTYLPSIST